MAIPSNVGLTPQQELEQWAKWRKSVDPITLSGDEGRYYNGPSPRPNDPRFDNPLFSKEAGAMFVNAKSHFDPKTGTVQKNKGLWDLPETYAIIASAAAPFAAPAIIGAMGAGAAGGGAGATAASTAGAGTTVAGGSTALASMIPHSAGGWLSLAKDVAPLLTANAAGRAQGRGVEADINQSGDRNQIALYNALLGNNQAQNAFSLGRGNLANANAATDLSQRQFALQAPRQRGATAVQGDILTNAKDATVSGVSSNIPVPTISGGLRPSMFSDSTRQLGSLMSKGALEGQQKGDTFAPGEPLPTWQNPPAAPGLTPTPEANGLDTALTTGGNVLNWAGTFADYLKKYKHSGTTDLPPSEMG